MARAKQQTTRIYLAPQDAAICTELADWTRAKTTAEALVASVTFLVREILPAYDLGFELCFISSTGEAQPQNWQLVRNPPDVSAAPRHTAGRQGTVEDIHLDDETLQALLPYSPGRRSDRIGPLVIYAARVLHASITRSRANWNLLRISSAKREAVAIERYLKPSSASPAMDLVGGLRLGKPR
jgi:hypothetical protein